MAAANIKWPHNEVDPNYTEMQNLLKGANRMKVKKTIRFLMMASFIRCIVELLILVHPLVIRIPWHLLTPTPPKNPAEYWLCLVAASFLASLAVLAVYFSVRGAYRWIFGKEA